MKIRTTKYIVKEGFQNTYRNKLMSLASIGIITASLIIFGIFLLITVNLKHNTAAIKDQLEMEIFCKPELEDAQVKQIEDTIMQDVRVREYKTVTKKDAYEKAKNMLGDNKDVLEGIDESFLPVSFKIKLKNPEESARVVEEFGKLNGVEEVKYSQKTVDFISRITYWVRFISGFLITVLLVISMFIISNTIKLTVFARRKEINIMKYIGATDWFIRWPFVIEGVIIGFIGALVAFVLTSYGYSALEGKFNNDLLNISRELVRFVKVSDVAVQLMGFYLLIGLTVGSLGSFISLRKYLRV